MPNRPELGKAPSPGEPPGPREAPSLFRRLLARFLIVLGFLCLSFSAFSFLILGATYRSATETGLLETARALAASYGSLPPESPEAAESWARTVGKESGLRITLVAANGDVLADSSGEASLMDNHASRPEIAAALSGKEGMATRVSDTLGMERRYAAVPLRESGGSSIGGALRVSADLPSLRSRLKPAYAVFGLLALFAAALALIVASSIASRIARPLGTLASAALALKNKQAGGANLPAEAEYLGRLVAKPDLAGTRELEILAGALASMAAELSERIAKAEAGENELGAIIEAMTEALLVIDSSLGIRLANAKARELFGLEWHGPRIPLPGPGILKATRSQELERLAARVGESGESAEAEIRFHAGGTESVYLASARPYGPPSPDGIQDSDSRHADIVLLLADVTRIRRLETVRKDFVANVSHELRTPIQIIKGFSENLLGGALEDAEQMRRFASIINRNASRMENLVDDLLSLARLEQNTGRLETRREKILPLISEAAEILEDGADRKSQTLLIDCPTDLEWEINPGLFVQALVNLVGNAIQYSGEGEPIRVKAGIGDSGDLEVSVEDRGPGIPAADLPRIFERFYRVDKARSRSKGGTGLGLAIVKHIAMAHGGRVEAESWEAEGSVFTMFLPPASPAGSSTGALHDTGKGD
ncbi:MAG TPA: ATP-binding protein [Rectinemataceae bacterium]